MKYYVNENRFRKMPDIVYKAIAYVSYEFGMESYIKFLEEMKLW